MASTPAQMPTVVGIGALNFDCLVPDSCPESDPAATLLPRLADRLGTAAARHGTVCRRRDHPRRGEDR
jgi:hypothetical protein